LIGDSALLPGLGAFLLIQRFWPRFQRFPELFSALDPSISAFTQHSALLPGLGAFLLIQRF